MVKLTFNETTYEFLRHRNGTQIDSPNELHLYKDGELIYTQHMHVDMFELNLLTFERCVDIIKQTY